MRACVCVALGKKGFLVAGKTQSETSECLGSKSEGGVRWKRSPIAHIRSRSTWWYALWMRDFF